MSLKDRLAIFFSTLWYLAGAAWPSIVYLLRIVVFVIFSMWVVINAGIRDVSGILVATGVLISAFGLWLRVKIDINGGGKWWIAGFLLSCGSVFWGYSNPFAVTIAEVFVPLRNAAVAWLILGMGIYATRHI